MAESLVAFASGLLLGVGGIALKGKVVTRLRDRKAKKASAAAREQSLQRAEAAEALLKARGYTIVARDAPASYAVNIDGEPMVVNVSADFLIEHEGKRFVAEVKVGGAAKLDNPATRWQFLEHQHAFGMRSVLLVNPDVGELSMLRFPLPKTSLTAVAPPPKQVRAPSALTLKKAKDKARTVRRRRLLRTLAIAAALGLAVWLFREGDDAADADTAHEARPRPSRVVTK